MQPFVIIFACFVFEIVINKCTRPDECGLHVAEIMSAVAKSGPQTPDKAGGMQMSSQENKNKQTKK